MLSRARRLRGPILVAAGTGVLWLVLGRGYLGYDTEWSLIWGGEIVRGELPDYSPVSTAPTPHPLATAASALLHPLGDAAPTVLLVLHMAAFATLAYQLFELGRALVAWPVGALAAALALTRPQLVEQTLYASLDVVFLALVAAAAAAEARRPRRGVPVLVLLALAGLLRPEAWVLAAAYTLYLLTAAERRRWPLLIGLGAAAPLIWVLADLIVTGDPLYSRHSTLQITDELLGSRPGGTGGPRGRGVLAELWDHLRDVLTPAVAGCGVAGLVAGLCLLRARVLLPAAICGLGAAAFVALDLADSPLLARYVLLPASMLALFCGVAGFGWLGLEPRRPVRTAWMLAALAVPAVLIPSVYDDARRIERVADVSGAAGDAVRDLDRFAETPAVRAAARRCRPILVERFGYRPQVALALEIEPEEIVVPRDRSPARGLALLPAGSAPPAGFARVASSGSWALYAAC